MQSRCTEGQDISRSRRNSTLMICTDYISPGPDQQATIRCWHTTNCQGHTQISPGTPPTNSTTYRSLVGGLMCALITRPDVEGSSGIYVQSPTTAAKESYATRTTTLHHGVMGRLSGYLVYVGKCLVAWKSKLHPSVCFLLQRQSIWRLLRQASSNGCAICSPSWAKPVYDKK